MDVCVAVSAVLVLCIEHTDFFKNGYNSFMLIKQWFKLIL